MKQEVEQEEIGAIYRGEPIQLPLDLFIPPDALELWLESFEGPFDLLLYLIRKNNFDILDIPISEITKQYMEYVDLLKKDRFELASDYLVMAAWLAEIKSRLLLPKHKEIEDEQDEYDPRRELIERLQLYAQYKQSALDISKLPKFHEEIFPTTPLLPQLINTKILPEVHVNELAEIMHKLLKKQEHFTQHVITREVLSVQERMVAILDALSNTDHISFEQVLNPKEGKLGIAVSFIAILELAKQQLIELIQDEAYQNIYLKLY